MAPSDPWLKTETETEQAYRAFCDYRDMGADRSLQKLLDFYEDPTLNQQATREIPTNSLATLKRWSRLFNWQERLEAWNLAQSRIAAERAAIAIAQEHDRRLERFREFNQDNGDAMLSLAKDLLTIGKAMVGAMAKEVREIQEDQANGKRIALDKIATSTGKVCTVAAQLAQVGANISAVCLGVYAQGLDSPTSSNAKHS